MRQIQIRIDGYSYGGAEINLDVYNWMGVEYYLDAADAQDMKMYTIMHRSGKIKSKIIVLTTTV